MAKTVKIIVDDVEYEVPAGLNLVDAAKLLDNNIPVFCYHPKMKPVGMCRMCLVEMGSLMRNRETGELELDEQGKPKVRWMPKLQTACTNVATDGLVIRTASKMVDEARENVLEFLLTSHPLDCPICDKGGECPLQNLTMEHGPGKSRMNFEDKMHLDKHVPLGELIFLDEERCIQCARCIRFQDEVAGDDVLAFHERGRTLQIITNSDPGFDSYFSGNTTDICPVGALTTADFRFGARPWELTNIPSIDPFDAAGSNITFSTRLDRDFGGKAMIKRVMPRQNEYVNEIWISDKARFGHHFTRSAERLLHPTLRDEDGRVSRVNWQTALKTAAEKLSGAAGDVAVIAGGSLSTEDMWTLRKLVEGLGVEQPRLGAWAPTHAGGDLLAQVGVGAGTNFKDMGAGDAVLIIATDLEEEVPIWRLRVKQARDRGAYVVVANARPTRMDMFASLALRYDFADAANAFAVLGKDYPDVMKKLADAANLVIIAGAEGVTLEGSRALMQSAANFLIESGHVGKPNNGLLSPLPGANGMGLHYMGFSPEAALDIMAKPPKVLIVAQADILDDDPFAVNWLNQVETIIALNLFPEETTANAEIVLPVQSFAERDGTFINGERRVQRFYTAQGPMGESLPLWQIVSRLGETLGQGRAKLSAASVMLEITQNVPGFENCRYGALAQVEQQLPLMGREDLYYGGTAYDNTGGLGVQLATAADRGEAVVPGKVTLPQSVKAGGDDLLVVPTVRLYNRQWMFRPSAATILSQRTPDAYVELSSATAARLGISDGDLVEVSVENAPVVRVKAVVNGGAPDGVLLLPRHLTETPTPLTIARGAVTKVELSAV
jgi:NADH-quinone oxidoreductase subunit G